MILRSQRASPTSALPTSNTLSCPDLSFPFRLPTIQTRPGLTSTPLPHRSLPFPSSKPEQLLSIDSAETAKLQAAAPPPPRRDGD
jgi:hypothetical protein